MKRKFSLLIPLLVLLLSTGAYAYMGKVFIYKSAITAANLEDVNNLTILVYSAKPDQTGGLANQLTVNVDYTLNRDAKYEGVTDSVLVDVSNCPAAYVYILLKNANRYAIPSAQVFDPAGPDQTIQSVASYVLDQPAAPTIGDISAGYETAKVQLTYSPDYDYASINVALKDKDGNDVGVTSTILKNPNDYKIGKLVDGRELKTDSDGEKYTFYVQGNVDGVDSSASANKDFTTQPLAAAVEVLQTWIFKKPTTGINTFAIPFKDLNAIKGIVGEVETQVDISTVGKLIAEINRQAGANVVTVFGWYDETTQTHKGLTSINYPDGTLAGAEIQAGWCTATGDTVVGAAIVQDRPYQVSVNAEVTFKLKGFKQ